MTELTPIEKHDHDLALHTKNQSSFKSHLAGIGTAFATVFLCTAITYASHFTFGFFKIIFGVLTGYAIKYFGKGSGARFGNIAGIYAVVAVLGYEWILSTFFIASNDPSLIKGANLEDTKEFLETSQSLSHIIYEISAAAVAYYIAYRIGNNPMKKDELDYLLEAKGISVDSAKSRQRLRRH